MKQATDYLPTRYWLMKSEPDVFSIQDLVARPKQEEFWDGVRNYQARNFMRDNMKVGDKILFYHSNATPPGIAGTAEVVKLASPDPTAFDKKSEYYDPSSKESDPRWVAVTVGKPKVFKHFVSLDDLRNDPAIEEMLVLRRGQRLSVQPVSKEEFQRVVELGAGKI
jgi:predicted RNA-binding protein with PUA-like domain